MGRGIPVVEVAGDEDLLGLRRQADERDRFLRMFLAE
jgi:hypothetical protein